MAVSAVPKGLRTLTPHLVIRQGDGAAAIEFYKKAFDAQENYRMHGPDGKSIVHAEMKIGDSVFFLAEEFPNMQSESRSPKALGGASATMTLFLENVDQWFKRAIDAGAKESMPLMDAFWGDRYGKLVDPFGHEWALAQHLEDVSPEEMSQRAEKAMKEWTPPGK